jgi:hypothetical protein
MLTENDKAWLDAAYPELKPDGQGVSGTIAFNATYDPDTKLFFHLDETETGEAKGKVLFASFKVRIAERTKVAHSALPAVFVDGVETTMGRHFAQQDKSACLCSPFSEGEYLQPQFNFIKFLEELVLPFLYGQAYYSLEGRWPWEELSHGAMGILESYQASKDRQIFEKCMRLLQIELKIWRRVLVILRQEAHLKGNMHCFCGSKIRIKDCHPRALEGANRIRRDMKGLGLAFH